MANSFWRWKDANCNGKNIEWVEMTVNEFKAFMKSDEREGRYFIRLGKEICCEADVIFIEATYEQYQNWRSEMLHHFYLRRVNPGFKEVSLDYYDEDNDLSMHEIVAAAGFTPEEITVVSEIKNILWIAISSLNEKRRTAILAKFYWYPDKSDEEVAALLGVSYDIYKNWKYRALHQLKNFYLIK